MKKALLIFSMLFSFCLISKAQFTQIAASPEFKEPRGSSALLLMKSGNLILVEAASRDSIRIRLYNKEHEEVAVTSYGMHSDAKRSSLWIRKAFEINGDAVLFVGAIEEKVLILYRLIVDSNTGRVTKEKYLVESKPEARDELFAVWEGNFSISKAEGSDDYAIAYCTNYQSEKVKQIKIIMFNKEHAEVSKAYYETTEKEFLALNFRGLVVVNAEITALLLNGYGWKGDERKMFLALTRKGSSALTIIEQKFQEEKLPRDSRLFYNSYSKKLVLAAVCVCDNKKDNKYLYMIDPESGKTDKKINYAFNNTFHEKFEDIYGRKYLTLGAPMNLLVDKNGNFSVIYQADGTISTSSGASTYSTALEITVADFDKNDKLLNNYLVPRKIVMNPNRNFGDSYESYAYIKNNDRAFILFNDQRENIERLEKNKDPKQVIVVKDCDAFYFPLTGSNVVPARKYLYKETDDREEHIQFSFGATCVYDTENDIFITVRLNRDEKKRTKTVNVVWLKPQ
jgi:hypothetical protein